MPKCILSGQVKSTFTQEQADGRYLQLSGGTLTGALKYPEGSVFEILNVGANAGGKLQLTSVGDMHGAGINVGNTNVFQAIKMDDEGAPTLALKYVVTPTNDTDAANKGYVDGLIGDINAQLGAFVQKTANLSGTDYTTIRARGIQLVSSAPGTLPNGCIAIVYS